MRHADDWVILCKGSAERPLRKVTAVLEKCDLRLSEKKTPIVNSYKESFAFLGLSFRMPRSRRSGKYYSPIEPSKRSIERIRGQNKRDPSPQAEPPPLLVMEMNQATRGWSVYFPYGHSTKVMSGVKWFTEERMRKQLYERYNEELRKAVCGKTVRTV